MSIDKVDSVRKSENIPSSSSVAQDLSKGNKKVVIPLSEQTWVPFNINPNDYATITGLRKHFPLSDYSLEKLPKELIESNGGAGQVRLGGETVTLDELTMYHSYVDDSYGSIGVKHTPEGDVIYIDQIKDGYTITSKYVNGELKHVEKTQSGSSGIMPWA